MSDLKTLFAVVLASLLLCTNGWAQEVKTKNSKSWEVSGRIQLQYLYDTEIDGDAAQTNNGFRMRRGRLQAKGKLTDWISTKFQIELRDNDPRLKDAEAKIKLGKTLYARVGQFKVPVWREEFMRSSGSLLLVERSSAANFLITLGLSAQQIGIELGGRYKSGVSWAANISNGSGEGNREDAGRPKSDFTNNGKLVIGRVNVPIGKKLQIGVSGAANRVGSNTGASDNSGTIWAIAPDFGFYTFSGDKGKITVEGGLALGSISSDFLGTADNVNFRVVEVTGRWTKKFAEPNPSLGGLDAVEFAVGISYVEPNDDVDDNETTTFRFGPAVYFGKNARLQVNGEIVDSSIPTEDTVFRIRAQTTFNF